MFIYYRNWTGNTFSLVILNGNSLSCVSYKASCLWLNIANGYLADVRASGVLLWSIGGAVAFCALAAACTACAAHTTSAAHTVPVPSCERDRGVSPVSQCNHNMASIMPSQQPSALPCQCATPQLWGHCTHCAKGLDFYLSSRQDGVGVAGQSHRHVVMGFTDDSTQPTVRSATGVRGFTVI